MFIRTFLSVKLSPNGHYALSYEFTSGDSKTKSKNLDNRLELVIFVYMRPLLFSLIILTFFSCSKDDATPENLPPSDFEVTVISQTFTSSAISWTSSTDPEGGDIRYSVYLETDLVTDTVTSGSFTFKDLAPEVSYSGKVVAEDQQGKKAIASFTFKTTPGEFPDEDFILPKSVNVITILGGPGHYYHFRDSAFYMYTYDASSRISSIHRHLKSYDLYADSVIRQRDVYEKHEFIYDKRRLDIVVYNLNNNNLVKKHTRFKFNNDRYYYPEYSTELVLGQYDSSVYYYSEQNFLKEIHRYINSDFLNKQEFAVTEESVNVTSRAFTFSEIPAKFAQFSGFITNWGSTNTDPLSYPIRMFRASEFLAKTGGGEPGAFTYQTENDRVTYIHYYSDCCDGRTEKFYFEY